MIDLRTIAKKILSGKILRKVSIIFELAGYRIRLLPSETAV
jgi:hypothetical protein